MNISPSVLLVDDNPTFLRIAVRFLSGQPGLTVVGTAGGGMEALEKAAQLHPDVVLLDMVMPDLPGLAVIPRLRENSSTMIIIALTLLDNEAYRQAALAAGANGFVAKSQMNVELIPTIMEHFQPVLEQ